MRSALIGRGGPLLLEGPCRHGDFGYRCSNPRPRPPVVLAQDGVFLPPLEACAKRRQMKKTNGRRLVDFPWTVTVPSVQVQRSRSYIKAWTMGDGRGGRGKLDASYIGGSAICPVIVRADSAQR